MIVSLEGKGELMREEIEKEREEKIYEKLSAHKHLFLRFIIAKFYFFQMLIFEEQNSFKFRHIHTQNLDLPRKAILNSLLLYENKGENETERREGIERGERGRGGDSALPYVTSRCRVLFSKIQA